MRIGINMYTCNEYYISLFDKNCVNDKDMLHAHYLFDAIQTLSFF